jgi:hypothetical protein
VNTPGATLNYNGMTIGNNDGNGTFNLSAGAVNVTGNTTLAFTGAVGIGTFNLSGGTFTESGTLQLGINNGGTAVPSTTPHAVVNISGGTLNMTTATPNATSTIQIGSFANTSTTITQTGGTLAFVNSDLTPNPAGRLMFQKNSFQNMGTYIYNLNGGVFQVGTIGINITAVNAAVPADNHFQNIRATINFNGGTLRAAGSNATFFNPGINPALVAAIVGGVPASGPADPIATIVKSGTSTIDTAGFNVAMDVAFAHDPALSASTLDGGLNFNDSAVTPGTLTLTGSGGTFNGGAIVTRGTVIAGADAIAGHSVSTTGTNNIALGTNSAQVVSVPDSTLLSLGESVVGPGVPAGTVIAGFTSYKIIPTDSYTGAEIGAGSPVLPFGTINLLGPAAGKIYAILSNPTTLNNGDPATLTFGASSPVGAQVVMNGGVFTSTNFTAPATRDLSTTTLKATASSTIDMSATAGTPVSGTVLRLADSSQTHWAEGAILTISDYTQGQNQLFVGSNNTTQALNPNQLAQIKFGSAPVGAIQLATGEVQPGSPTGMYEHQGDVNHDTHVDISDVSAMEVALTDVTKYTNDLVLDSGWSSKALEAKYLADTDLSEVIDNRDLQAEINYLANHAGSLPGPGGGSLTAVPEPSTFVLLALGGLAVCGAAVRRQSKDRS